MTVIKNIKRKARHIKAESYALIHAMKDDRTPWYAKVLVSCIVAYALSPIDLIPDFIPVIGYLDDLILLPLAIMFTIKLIPDEVMIESRVNAQKGLPNNKISRYLAAIVILSIWLLTVVLILQWFNTNTFIQTA